MMPKLGDQSPKEPLVANETVMSPVVSTMKSPTSHSHPVSGRGMGDKKIEIKTRNKKSVMEGSAGVYSNFVVPDTLKKRKSLSALIAKPQTQEANHSGPKSNNSYLSGSSIALNENLRGRLTVNTSQPPKGKRKDNLKKQHQFSQKDLIINQDIEKLERLQKSMQRELNQYQQLSTPTTISVQIECYLI